MRRAVYILGEHGYVTSSHCSDSRVTVAEPAALHQLQLNPPISKFLHLNSQTASYSGS